MRTPIHTLLIALVLAPACTTTPAADDFEDESALQDPSLGKADEPGSTFTYFTMRQDVRRCAYPVCGGAWVDRVNRDWTRCAGGAWREECYVPEVDWSELGLGEAERSAVMQAYGADRLVVRGWIERRTYPGHGNLGRFVVSEAWVAGSAEGYDEGVFVRAGGNGVTCITYPCSSIHEAKLNSNQHADIADLDFWYSGATEDEIAGAWQALASDGLIVVGYRYTATGPAGDAKARDVSQFWTRVMPGAEGGCYVGGCSAQVCSDRPDAITTCEWLPEYECYRTAECARQPDGNCGWTETLELEQCLEGAR
jgi:hypothetical protein